MRSKKIEKWVAAGLIEKSQGEAILDYENRSGISYGLLVLK